MTVRRPVIVVVALAAVAAAAWAWLDHTGQRDGTLVLYGNVDIREVELAFRQPGRLATMNVDEGHEVRSGQLLAELDARPYADALAAAEAEVRGVEAALAKLRRGNRPQEIARAEEAVREARAIYDRTDSEWRRQLGLAAQKLTSEQALEAARAARDTAEAGLGAARQELSLQREGARAEDVAAAEARLAAAEAARSQAATALDDTRLLAPADGVVLARVREPGSMVSNRDPVYTLSLREPVYVRAYVGEPDLGRVAPGTPVRVISDSSDETFEGHVGFISPRAEFTPRSVETTDLRTDLVYRLRIVVTAPGAARVLRQGMPVTVEVAAAPAGG